MSKEHLIAIFNNEDTIYFFLGPLISADSIDTSSKEELTKMIQLITDLLMQLDQCTLKEIPRRDFFYKYIVDALHIRQKELRELYKNNTASTTK